MTDFYTACKISDMRLWKLLKTIIWAYKFYLLRQKHQKRVIQNHYKLKIPHIPTRREIWLHLRFRWMSYLQSAASCLQNIPGGWLLISWEAVGKSSCWAWENPRSQSCFPSSSCCGLCLACSFSQLWPSWTASHSSAACQICLSSSSSPIILSW